jgi:hypothetical protein
LEYQISVLNFILLQPELSLLHTLRRAKIGKDKIYQLFIRHADEQEHAHSLKQVQTTGVPAEIFTQTH